MKTYLQLLSLAFLLIPMFGTAQKPASAEFINSPDGLHYAIIRLNPIDKGENGEIQKLEPIKQEEVIKQIGKLNNKLGENNLRLSQIYLIHREKTEPVITVRRFQNYMEAKAYCSEFEKALNEQEERSLIIEVLPISQMNYRACLKKNSAKGYKKYYTEVLEMN